MSKFFDFFYFCVLNLSRVRDFFDLFNRDLSLQLEFSFVGLKFYEGLYLVCLTLQALRV